MTGSGGRRFALVGLLLCTLPLVGCPGPATHTQSSVDPGFGVSDVELLEVILPAEFKTVELKA